MKKIQLILMSIFAVAVLCSCSGTDDTTPDTSTDVAVDTTVDAEIEDNITTTMTPTLLSPADPITVTFWHYYGTYVEEELTAIVDEFNRTIGEEYGVKVETVAKPSIYDLEVELSEAAQGVVYANEMPSMFLAYADKILELQSLGVISNLDDYFTETDKSLIIDSFLSSGIISDEQVMMPVVKSTELIYINDTLWQEFCGQTGFTDDDLLTWEGVQVAAGEYFDYTDDLTPDVANDGKALFGIDSLQNFICVTAMQLGVDMFDGDAGSAVLNEEVLKEIFDYYTECVSLGYFASIGKFRTDDMRSGDIVGFAGSSASFTYVPNWIEVDGQKQDIEWKALPYPYFEDGTPQVLSQGAGVAVSKITDQQQEACALFLNYFLESNIDFALESAYVPVVAEFLEKDADEKNEMFNQYELADNSVNAYQLVIEQIENEQLYQPDTFSGSYAFRTEIASMYEQVASSLYQLAQEKIASGVSREDVVEQLKLDEQFDAMIIALKESLVSQGVAIS